MIESVKRFVLFLAVAVLVAAVSAADATHFSGVHQSAEMIFIYGVELSFSGGDAVAGDEIGVFTQAGVLCGATRVQGLQGFPAISVYKDDPLTLEIDGAHTGDPLVFRYWRAAEAKEYSSHDIELTYVEKENLEGLPYWTTGNDVYRVDLRAGVAQDDSIRLTLSPGWNLISLPFLTANQGPAETILVRDDGTPAISGSAWLWNATTQRYVKQTAGFPAKQGFWVYCTENVAVTTARIVGSTVTSDIALERQWNLVGPSRTACRADVPGLDEAVQTAWRWDAHSRQYKLLQPEAPLDRGRAYWFLISPQSPAATGGGAPGPAGKCNLLRR